MNHDPMCWYADPDKIPAVAVNDGWPCLCTLIARVREDERTYAKQSSTAIMAYDEGRQDGYAAALRDAAEEVKAYADERLVLTKHPNASEDITAALRVAAKRIEALGGKQ